MQDKLLCSVALLAVVALLMAGCSGEPADAPDSGDDEPSVKTMDEYRSEAAEEINAENAESELNKLEEEIEADQ